MPEIAPRVNGPRRCERDCEVAWGPGPKKITLHRAKHEPIALTRKFPYGEIDPDTPRPPRVDEIVLSRAAGNIVCGSETIRVEGRDITWKTGIRSAGPIMLER